MAELRYCALIPYPKSKTRDNTCLAVNDTVKNKCYVTPNSAAVELPLILASHFNCFKDYILFECSVPQNKVECLTNVSLNLF